MIVLGGLFVTIFSIFSIIISVIKKYNLSGILLSLFFIFSIVGHGKTGTQIHWIIDDFTYWLSNIIFIYLLLQRKKINSLLFVYISFTLLSYFFVDNGIDGFKNSEMIYQHISAIIYTYVLSQLIILRDENSIDIVICRFFMLVFFILLILFIIQITLPFHGINVQLKRDFVMAGGVDILGYTFARALGLSGTAHNAGSGLILSYYFAFLYSHKTCLNNFFTKGITKYLVFLFTLFLAGFAQRIFWLALIIFIIYFSIKYFLRLNHRTTLFLCFIISFISIFYVNWLDIIAVGLDESNILKISIWYDLITNYKITTESFFFGNGMGSSVNATNSLRYNDFNEIYFGRKIQIYNDMSYSVHNIFLQFFYEKGFLFFIIWIYYITKIVSKNISMMVSSKILSLEFIFLATFFLNSFFHNSFGFFFLFLFLAYYKKTKFN